MRDATACGGVFYFASSRLFLVKCTGEAFALWYRTADVPLIRSALASYCEYACMSSYPADKSIQRGQFQLSAAYAFYLSAIALSVTYWPLYFEDSGLSGVQIGVIFSVATAMSIVMQPLVSAMSDAWGRPVRMLRLAFLWSMLLPSAMLFIQGFWVFALAWWLSSLMSIAIVPLLDASIVRRVGADRYGGIRLWGSVGYGLAVLVYGWFMRDQPTGVTGYGAIILWVVLLFCGAAVVWTLPTHASDAPARTRGQGLGRDWVTAPLVILFLINALHWWGITSFNIYIGLHASERGIDTGVIGMTVAAAIVGEVVAFALARRILAPHLAHWVLPLIFITGAVRWVVTALTLSPAILIGVQLLHFFGYGLWMVALIHLIGRFVPDEQRTAAQGLMGGLIYGVGGMLGNLVSGVMFDIGGGEMVFMVAAGADLLACVLLVLTWKLWVAPRNNPIRLS